MDEFCVTGFFVRLLHEWHPQEVLFFPNFLLVVVWFVRNLIKQKKSLDLPSTMNYSLASLSLFNSKKGLKDLERFSDNFIFLFFPFIILIIFFYKFLSF